jgi:hypothetical protein
MELQGDIPNEQDGQCLPCGSSKKTSKSRGSAKFTSSHKRNAGREETSDPRPLPTNTEIASWVGKNQGCCALSNCRGSNGRNIIRCCLENYFTIPSIEYDNQVNTFKCLSFINTADTIYLLSLNRTTKSTKLI